jgi:hypothetical protein
MQLEKTLLNQKDEVSIPQWAGSTLHCSNTPAFHLESNK